MWVDVVFHTDFEGRRFVLVVLKLVEHCLAEDADFERIGSDLAAAKKILHAIGMFLDCTLIVTKKWDFRRYKSLAGAAAAVTGRKNYSAKVGKRSVMIGVVVM